ncbi:Actin-depolymerizing factor gmf1 [Cladobotryum mycophilum]|uniref:Actin-depolymerizing factor gmf1 n=1 Tax=Cladobotryum mycophilum TaxID=491253 RepID=A0ABR0T3Z4_9HYPO
MASESRLYQFSGETKDFLRKFRMTTSRAKDPQAVVFYIDKETHEVRQDDEMIVYASLDELADELPDHAPRYVLLSYPLTKSDGRLSVPYVMLYYLPVTCNAATRMLYAGAKELMRNMSEVNRVFDVVSKDDLEDIPDSLKAE